MLNGSLDDDVVNVFDKTTRLMIQNKMDFDIARIPEVI